MDKLHEHVPAKLKEALEAPAGHSVAEKLYTMLGEIRSEKSMSWDLAGFVDGSISQGYYQQQKSAVTYQVAAQKSFDNFWLSLTAQETKDLATEVSLLVKKPWFTSGDIAIKVNALFGKTLAVAEDKNILQRDLVESVCALRQEQGIRTSSVNEFWVKTFAQKFEKWSPSGQPYEKDLLRLGLVMCAAKEIPAAASEIAQNILIGMIRADVPMEKVPVRWAKNYDKPLGSVVQGWLLEATLSQTKKGKKAMQAKEEAPVKKRRM